MPRKRGRESLVLTLPVSTASRREEMLKYGEHADASQPLRRQRQRVQESERLVAAAAFELIALVSKKYVEAGERAVAATDVALELDLDVFWQVGRVHLL